MSLARTMLFMSKAAVMGGLLYHRDNSQDSEAWLFRDDSLAEIERLQQEEIPVDYDALFNLFETRAVGFVRPVCGPF